MNDALGDRMKQYEACTQYLLPINSYVIIRVDGRAFHTFTKDMEKPFSSELITNMALATKATMAEIGSCCKLAYTQSDEATFLLTDTDKPETQPWFGNNVLKLVSVTASIFTAMFNMVSLKDGATFDARAFTVPREEVPNMFLWRHKDWNRNSLQMLARSVYSHSELHGKKHPEIHELLWDKGINWFTLEDREKDGTYVTKNTYVHLRSPTYEVINNLVNYVLTVSSEETHDSSKE